MTTMYEAMLKYLQDAVDSREAVYQIDRESIADLLKNKPNATEQERVAAKQKGRSHAVAKEHMAGNRWNMMQTVMFGVVTLSINSFKILNELTRIRKLLEANYGTPRT